MSECRYVVENQDKSMTRKVTLERDYTGVNIKVNGEMVCSFEDGNDYLSLYGPATSCTGLLKDDSGCLKVVR